MAWVNIKGHRYYRRSKRVGGHVVTEHVGRGEMAEAMACYDKALREHDRAERECERSERLVGEHTFLDFFGLDDFLADVVAALAHRQGWHRHKRQWRKQRGADVGEIQRLRRQVEEQVAKLEAAQAARPLLTPDLAGVAEADRALLAKAATDDAAGLAAAEPYFQDAARLRRWGDPVYAARCWLVWQSCGEDSLVRRSTHRFADAMQEGLGWAKADALQRIAILRVVNNWLAVGVLEAKANRINPELASRTPIERALTNAERRLMQAVRMLAVLRGVRPAELLAVLPASPMS
jgi:hypothetical protein